MGEIRHRSIGRGGAAGADDDQLPELRPEDIQAHEGKDDLWVIVGGRVYGVADYMAEHPGGEEVLIEHGGRDATGDFQNVGHGPSALAKMRTLLVGKVTGARLLSDDELSGKGGGGSAGLLVVIIFLVIIGAYAFLTNKNASTK
eukprot:Hpha_TRINITY_DN35810_c0_g1::TRINITY_DN35810_c0_g1_i1::g.84869::m.84869